MKLIKDQLVKIMFRNGQHVEGIVDIWDKDYVLRSEDGKSVLIIQDPEQDIMLIKVVLRNDEEDGQHEEHKMAEESPKKSNDKPVVCDDIPLSEDLRHKKMAELYLAAAASERQTIVQKMRDHRIGEVKPINYGYPSILNKTKGND